MQWHGANGEVGALVLFDMRYTFLRICVRLEHSSESYSHGGDCLFEWFMRRTDFLRQCYIVFVLYVYSEDNFWAIVTGFTIIYFMMDFRSQLFQSPFVLVLHPSLIEFSVCIVTLKGSLPHFYICLSHWIISIYEIMLILSFNVCISIQETQVVMQYFCSKRSSLNCLFNADALFMDYGTSLSIGNTCPVIWNPFEGFSCDTVGFSVVELSA